MYEWKIRSAKSYLELEKLVEQIQDEGWTIQKIDMGSVAVIAYRPKKKEDRSELLTENQDEGRLEPDVFHQETDFEWDRGDYGQQSF